MKDDFIEWKVEALYWKKKAKLYIDRLAAILEQESSWISVEDRLPEVGKPVLAITKGGTMDVLCLGYWDDDSQKPDTWYLAFRQQHSNGNVTHWMPLPTLPS
ncbi:MAG: DUF551 domain-containing protein [Anaerolineae bacterium]|nr:DUF551 domain-containing protein [Anaerolineae bacterium]